MSGPIFAAESTSWLVPLAVAAVPAIASIIAALLSVRSARASRASEIEAARLRDLDNRLAAKKYEVYRPMIDLLRQMLVPGGADKAVENEAELIDRLSEFASWITIFGSDEAVKSFHNFMQGAYHAAPAPVTLRLYADFVLAARKDMGDRETSVTAAHVLGTRINDLYEPESGNLATASLSFQQLCEAHGWTVPWPDDPDRYTST